jgi:GNAT superfamily N-acetyltransferase
LATASLRPIRSEDASFLSRLYATTREREMSLVDVGPGEKQEFLHEQFLAQDAHYRRYFADAEFSVIEAGGEPVGRYYVRRGTEEYRVIDMALLPEWRGRGIGTALLRDLLDGAAEAGVPIRLRVEPQNRARRLYERLGFRTIADETVNLHLEWRAVA